MDQQEQTPQQLLEQLSFCVIDLETTGGNHEYDQIIEIGMVKIEKLTIVDELNFLINPNIPIPEFIQKLTSITEDKIVGAPTIDQVIEEVLTFIGDTVLVAHNTSFDIPFFNSVLKRLGKKTLQNKVLCTNVMTKFLIPEIMSSNLNYMSQVFKIDHAKAHRAIEDAKATAKLLLKYLDFFIQKKIRKVNQLYYPKNKFELDRDHFDRQTSLDELLAIMKDINGPLLATFKGEQGVICACVPIIHGSHSEGIEFFTKMYQESSWSIITLKMTSPFLRCLLYLSPHLPKIEPHIKALHIEYLEKLFPFEGNAQSELEKYDFIVDNHLVTNQLVLLPIINLGSNNALIFKYPSHKKKFLQFLCGQRNKFENQLKRRRRTHLDKSLLPILAGLLHKTHDQYLSIRLEEVSKKKDSELFRKVDHYMQGHPNKHNFPNTHL